ncbi:hypothetical protein [Microbacterium terrisoli]|uniref:hypothetical protein n=1 Tax=Microbacterium terrisoli TaxID=3242192 RepID=UPI0028042AB9|nr:hypothetical protein [Microbacterium protaetiae]
MTGRQRAAAAGSARRPGRAALWIWIVALVVGLALFPLLPGYPSPAFAVALIIGIVAAIVAATLDIRNRRAGASPRATGWVLGLGILALVIDLVLVITLVVGVLTRPNLTRVELRATGGPVFTVSFSDDVKQHVDEQWHDSGFARFNTAKSSTEITVNAPTGQAEQTVSCEIEWNGAVVAHETSTGGTVTCRYEAR